MTSLIEVTYFFGVQIMSPLPYVSTSITVCTVMKWKSRKNTCCFCKYAINRVDAIKYDGRHLFTQQNF